MGSHEVSERSRRCSPRSCASTSRRASRSSSQCSPARAGSACRRRPSGTCWRSSRRRVRAAAAHVGRPRAHRSGLPRLRRSAAREPQAASGTPRGRNAAAAAGGTVAADRRPAGERVARGVARGAARGLRAGRALTRPCSSASSSCRSAARACSSSSCSRGSQVTQKVVDAGEDVTPDELVQAANYLNTEFAGCRSLDVREAVLSGCGRSGRSTIELLARALRLARSTLEELPRQSAFYVEGAASLLDGPTQDGDLARHAARAARDDGRERAARPAC